MVDAVRVVGVVKAIAIVDLSIVAIGFSHCNNKQPKTTDQYYSQQLSNIIGPNCCYRRRSRAN